VYAETLSSKFAEAKSQSGIEEPFEKAELATTPKAIAEAANRYACGAAGSRAWRAADFCGNGSSE
jgi:hypothetical protein